jgi:uncharacterized BrkB/YihY/UPF0761 family membrane protein
MRGITLGTLAVMGGFVLVLWLHAIFFDRFQRVSARWWPVTENAIRMRPLFRVVATVLAVVASVGYGLMLLVYAMG